ncbi:MAG TPA: hypothetical protein ENH65_02190 [Candidatus Aminicenantes bacterium]|nr:hypothetical protein [Candidatus Aminicenantes bacterium]
MFVRIKKSGGHEYLQIVHSYRSYGGVKQLVLANLGRLNKYTDDIDLLDIGQSFKDLYKKLHVPPEPKLMKKRRKKPK